MVKIDQGTLTMGDQYWKDVKIEINAGYSPKQGLENIVEFNNLNINDIHSISLLGKQARNKECVETYSQVVCDFWNKGRG